MFESSPHIVRSASFLNGRIQLYQGDSKQLLTDLSHDPDRPPPFVDIVVSDPPYGILYVGMKHKAIANDEAPPVWCVEPMAAVLKPNCAMYICTREDVAETWREEMVRVGLKMKTSVIWDKQQWTMGDSGSDMRRQTEMVMIAHSGRALLRPWKDARFTGDPDKEVKRDTCLWSIKVPRDKLSQRHPTPKPPELMERALLNHSDPDGLILDPFMGGGPVGVAAIRQGRKYIGIELDAEYYDIAFENITRALQDAELDATPTPGAPNLDDFDWPELEGEAA